MEKYYRQYDLCRQNEKPFCSSACPFHLDILDFQSKMATANYNGAFKTFRNAVGFPDIVAALCPEYCASMCPRKDLDQAVQLSLLEKTCVAKATKKDPIDYNVPSKPRKIAIIGAGISGLACALRLAQKKYEVTIFEKTNRLGGKLWDLLPSELFLGDIKCQFQFEKYDLHFNTEVLNLSEIEGQGFEAVYVATGDGGYEFELLALGEEPCRVENGLAVFAGGGLIGKDCIPAIAHGQEMAWAIEVFLKTGKLEYPKEEGPCRAVANQDKLVKTDGVIPTEQGVFTDQETIDEAARCIRCQCDDCMTYCDVCSYHNKWPKRIRDDVMATVAFSTSPSMLKKTPAKRLMSTCTQCGLCEEVCPENIQIGEMLLEARRSLHRQGTLPSPFHQFWLRDMEFSNSKSVAMTKKAPGREDCGYAFFPGCQLGAANPNYVTLPYQWLLSKNPATGLMIRCCSVPADWAGDVALHQQEILAVRTEWEQLGCPILIMACPACQKHFKEYLPEIQTLSLYEILVQWGYEPDDEQNKIEKPESPKGSPKELVSIFDPCTARHEDAMEQAVRTLAVSAGMSLEEFPKGDLHGCCGVGGHGSVADPDFYDYVKKSRSELSQNPYVVYCINCRDVFISEEKKVWHILDLLFPIDEEAERLPNLTERRNNRTTLKQRLLMEVWGEASEELPPAKPFNLIIDPVLQQKMDRLKVLEEDLYPVIEYAETSGRQTYDPVKKTFSCYKESGQFTNWIEYKKDGENYVIINVYTHKFKIKLEGMWNGRKTGADL